ncbi:MAG TPA: hypothetical protein VLG68_05435 [Gammaproteobacteria bacterium]|nr:hypothetical protein [Gammaproteobacteria bacterium]
MLTSRNDADRLRLLIALGNQPGVSAWFGAWFLGLTRAAATQARQPQPKARFGTYLAGLR